MFDAAKDQADTRLTDRTLMAAFAAEWLRKPDEPFACVMRLFPLPEDAGVCAVACYHWPRDPFVLEEKRRLLSVGEGALVPSKEQALLLVYDIAEDKAATRAERLQAIRLFADMSGYIQKTPGQTTNLNIAGQSVMVVKDKGPEPVWSADLMKQQQGLQNDVNSGA
jgi:hypothetical protein